MVPWMVFMRRSRPPLLAAIMPRHWHTGIGASNNTAPRFSLATAGRSSTGIVGTLLQRGVASRTDISTCDRCHFAPCDPSDYSRTRKGWDMDTIDEVDERVRKVIATQLRKPGEQVIASSRLADDLGADS